MAPSSTKEPTGTSTPMVVPSLWSMAKVLVPVTVRLLPVKAPFTEVVTRSRLRCTPPSTLTTPKL
ncbi:hypothetical protein D3C71_2039160 [compost metagenome]